jgi:hypothetical protein
MSYSLARSPLRLPGSADIHRNEITLCDIEVYELYKYHVHYECIILHMFVCTHIYHISWMYSISCCVQSAFESIYEFQHVHSHKMSVQGARYDVQYICLSYVLWQVCVSPVRALLHFATIHRHATWVMIGWWFQPCFSPGKMVTLTPGAWLHQAAGLSFGRLGAEISNVSLRLNGLIDIDRSDRLRNMDGWLHCSWILVVSLISCWFPKFLYPNLLWFIQRLIRSDKVLGMWVGSFDIPRKQRDCCDTADILLGNRDFIVAAQCRTYGFVWE